MRLVEFNKVNIDDGGFPALERSLRRLMQLLSEGPSGRRAATSDRINIVVLR